jgi:hypothetical protein
MSIGAELLPDFEIVVAGKRAAPTVKAKLVALSAREAIKYSISTMRKFQK